MSWKGAFHILSLANGEGPLPKIPQEPRNMEDVALRHAIPNVAGLPLFSHT